MKLTLLVSMMTAMTVATVGLVIGTPAQSDTVYKVIGLTSNNMLVTFGKDAKKGTEVPSVRVKGIQGKLQGIDYRPANGVLYGVTDLDQIYSIDPKSGQARLVSTLTVSFNGGFQSGFDFNPVVDRLRIVGSNKQNLRTVIETGAVTVDTPLNYAATDKNAGVEPNITGAAYSNSKAGVTTTTLFGIDYDLDVLVTQNPPNAGTLNTVGPLGINFAPTGGFDIFTDAAGNNTAFAVSERTLYSIDLTTGTASKMGRMPDGVIGIAVTTSKR